MTTQPPYKKKRGKTWAVTLSASLSGGFEDFVSLCAVYPAELLQSVLLDEHTKRVNRNFLLTAHPTFTPANKAFTLS